ncbi:TetR/AcrR family transcriptional regulator [Micromonospora sp. NPDC023956]|uniref:TetR/AcrR family transcriptional regulator n=1 Tax=Micromonospora sp. NPDC023956 TaxID=3155722 RepID=UPI0033F45205
MTTQKPTAEQGEAPARRRRGAALDEAILRAAAAELRESGYAGLTMDRVARRAGTNKNALYRRWPHRAALGVAAYGYLADASLPATDTGALRGDALALLRQANATWSSPQGAVLRELLAATAEDPHLLASLREQAGGSTLNAAWLNLLSRAVARGEAPVEAVHPRVATLPMVLLRGEYALRGTPTVPDPVLVEIVDEVFLPLVRGRAPNR